MKTVVKRLLTCAAAFSLLVTCTISGLVLPVAATEPAASEEPVNLLSGGDMETGTPIVSTNAVDEAAISYETVTGYDGNENNRVLAVNFSNAVSTDSGNPTVFLTYAGAPTRANGLEAGKRYLLSFKIKGVACQFWGSNQWTGVTGKNTDINTSRWYGISAVIGATQEVFNAWRVIDKYNSSGKLYFDDFVLQELEDGGNLMPLANGDVWPLATGFNSMFEHSYAETNAAIGKGNLTIQTENDNRYYKIAPVKDTTEFFPHVATWGENLLVQKGIYQVSYRFRVHNKGSEALLPDQVLAMNPDASHSVFLGRFYTPADANGWRTCVLWFALGTKDVAKNDVKGNATFYKFKDGSCNWVLRTTLNKNYDYDLDDLTLRAVGTAAEYSAANAGNLQSVRIAGSKTLSIPTGSSVLLETEGTLNNGASWIAGAHTGTLTPSPVVLESNTWATVEGETITRIPENEERDPKLYTDRSWITATATATWASSDETVAKVDAASGYVTMVSNNPNDSATITVTATINGVPVTDSVVVKPLLIAPTAVALNKTTVKLCGKGSTETLAVIATAPENAWVDPANVTWTSSDESIVTVSNGVLTNMYSDAEEKKVTITATYNGFPSLTATVTVDNNLIPDTIFDSITTDKTQNVYVDPTGAFDGGKCLVIKNVGTKYFLVINNVPVVAGKLYTLRIKMKGTAVGAWCNQFGWAKLDDTTATGESDIKWVETVNSGRLYSPPTTGNITISFECSNRFTENVSYTSTVETAAYFCDFQLFEVTDDFNLCTAPNNEVLGITQKTTFGENLVTLPDGTKALQVEAFKNKLWQAHKIIPNKVYEVSVTYKAVDEGSNVSFSATRVSQHAHWIGKQEFTDDDGWKTYKLWVQPTSEPNTNYLAQYTLSGGAAYIKHFSMRQFDQMGAPLYGADLLLQAGTWDHVERKRTFFGVNSGELTYTSYDRNIITPIDNSETDENGVRSTDYSFWFTNAAIGRTEVTVTLGSESKTLKVMVLPSKQPVNAEPKVNLNVQNAEVAVKSNNGAYTDSLIDGNAIRVNVVPKAGYLPVPGSLRYVLADGTEHKLLTRVETETNAESTGYEFTMTVPEGNFTIKADMAPTTDNGYQIGTVGTSVHRNGSAEIDGVRFLTRMYVEELNLTGNTFTVKVDGKTKAIKSMGTLLKRASNAKGLTLENVGGSGATTVWQSECYNNTENRLKVVDYTNSYIDFAAVMMTNTPSDTFRNRDYVTCGYIVFADDSVIYTTPMTDSAAAAASRGA